MHIQYDTVVLDEAARALRAASEAMTAAGRRLGKPTFTRAFELDISGASGTFQWYGGGLHVSGTSTVISVPPMPILPLNGFRDSHAYLAPHGYHDYTPVQCAAPARHGCGDPARDLGNKKRERLYKPSRA
jgi:hypothetical protein